MLGSFKRYFNSDKKRLCKYLVIPDLHGTYSIYQQVEDYIKNRIEEDRIIIFLGDYLDRGESGELFGKKFKDIGSYKVVRGLISLKEWAKTEQRELILLRGNHERFYEQYFIQNDKEIRKDFYFVDKALECIDEVMKHDNDFKESFITFLSELAPYYLDKESKYLFVHAGVDPKRKDLDEQAKDETLYWIRDEFLFSEKKLDYTVIFGHTPFLKPYMKSDKIGLDSGVYKRGFFNMLLIDGDDSKIIKLYK